MCLASLSLTVSSIAVTHSWRSKLTSVWLRDLSAGSMREHTIGARQPLVLPTWATERPPILTITPLMFDLGLAHAVGLSLQKFVSASCVR